MDHLDIDHLVDVPDTPDRLTKCTLNGGRGGKVEKSNSSVSCNSGQENFCNGESENCAVVIDTGPKRLFVHAPKHTASSSSLVPGQNAATSSRGGSPSSKNALLFRKGVAEKNPRMQKGKLSTTSRSSSSFEVDGIVDLTSCSPVPRKAFPLGSRRDEFRKRSGITDMTSSSRGLESHSAASGHASKRTEGTFGVGSSSNDGGVEFVGTVQNNAGKGRIQSVDLITSPKVNRQKRLVRNGCISPLNIAKAKEVAKEDNNASTDISHGDMGSVAPDVATIRELVAEDHNSRIAKGKAVVNYPCSYKASNVRDKQLFSRNALNIGNRVKETSAQESGDWRSTRNRTANLSLSSSNQEQFLSKKMDVASTVHEPHENRLERRGKGTAMDVSHTGHPAGAYSISSKHVSASSLIGTVPHQRHQPGQCGGRLSAMNGLPKRRKQGSRSSDVGECSTSASDYPDVASLSSSNKSSRSRSSSSAADSLQPIIEVDELSPELRRHACDTDGARARQVEADERLARELQEQLYNELPVPEMSEFDAYLAMATQQEDPNHAFSRGGPPLSDPRGSFVANLRRQMLSRSSQNLSRGGSQSRALTSSRTTRSRGRFPGRPRTVASRRERNSMFPENMDVDMRMHILQALEDFSEMGVSSGLLQTQRDFNENDYEMLLALDDNNHHHGGTSIHQINSLPQSIVQSDSVGEDCAICLETPTLGDTIRHLPCLHKFHKDCIDQWLKRRTSCPVCKSSIT